MPSANDSGVPSVNTPYSLVPIISLGPALLNATTGSPNTIASRMAILNPSFLDGQTNKSASLRYG